EQNRFPTHQLQPLAWFGNNECQRATCPEARHLSRRELPAQFVLREFGRILLLILRSAAAIPQRLVLAISSGMIADKEIRSKLRGREIKATANQAVAHGDGQDHDRSTQYEKRACLHIEAQNGPAQDYGKQNNRVLARQA